MAKRSVHDKSECNALCTYFNTIQSKPDAIVIEMCHRDVSKRGTDEERQQFVCCRFFYRIYGPLVLLLGRGAIIGRV